MTSVIWTPAALRDVTRLRAFLAPKSRESEASRYRKMNCLHKSEIRICAVLPTNVFPNQSPIID
jgi:hypothetical protein